MSKIPKIKFRYSQVYDNQRRKNQILQDNLREKDLTYPSVKKIENLWRRFEKITLLEIAKITGLEWEKSKIICYVVRVQKFPFSDLLTIGIFQNEEAFIDILVHELIHNIFRQNINRKKVTRFFIYINKKYFGETVKTLNHIHLHVIHVKIYKLIFGEDRLEKNIDKDKKFQDYSKMWEIVEKKGSENLVGEMKKWMK